MIPTVRKLALAGLAFMAAGTSSAQGEPACPAGNVLAKARPHASYDAYHQRNLTDGVVAPDGGHWMSDVHTLFTSVGYVVFRLEQVTRLNSLVLHADSNDSYRISGSLDGESWVEIGRVPAVEGPGVRMRYATGFDQPVRFLRLAPAEGDGAYGVSEIAAYCGRPDPWPPVFEIRRGLVRDPAWSAARERKLAWAKMGLGLGGGLLLGAAAWARRRDRPWPRRLEWTVLVSVSAAAVLAWTNFATFHGPNAVHLHDMFHYVMGSKYFEETGHTLLYHCAEVAEAETGRRSFVERRVIRNLSTNEMQPGRAALDDPAACHTAFSPERWEAFKQDVEFFRSNDYPGSWGRIFRDHGYNATPVWTMAGRWITDRGSMSRRLGWLALVDWLLYAGMGLLILWAFGLPSLALSALLWGVGFPWQYYWTGGAFARTPWLFTLVAAVCLLRKGRFASGGFSLAVSALLRIFPVVLLAGPALYALGAAWRKRSPVPAHVRLLAGALLGVLLLVPLSAWSAGGLEVWSRFADNSAKHAGTPLGNHVGLATLFAWDPSRTQADLLTGRVGDFGEWEDSRRETLAARRALYWPAAIGVLLLVALFVTRHARAEWETVSASTLLVFAFSQLASYYLVFVVLLAPFAAGRPRRIALLSLAAVLSQAVQLLDAHVDTRFFLESLLFLVVPVVILIDLMLARRGDG